MMSTVLSKYVWIERLMVLLATVGVNIGIVTTTQESDIAAGGVTGAIVFVQIVMALVTHWRTLEDRLRADVAGMLTSLLNPPVPPPASASMPTAVTIPPVVTSAITDAAARAGKAPTP